MNRWVLLVCGALLLGIAVKVQPMGGDLRHPSLALPADAPTELRTRLMVILAEEDAKFLGGHFINAHTTLEYGGSTQALNRMVSKLAECGGVKVQLRFTNAVDGPAWSVDHNAWTDPYHLEVGINLGAASIKAGDLSLPVLGKPGPAKAIPSASPTSGPSQTSRP
jgi:hypothetical protein